MRNKQKSNTQLAKEVKEKLPPSNWPKEQAKMPYRIITSKTTYYFSTNKKMAKFLKNHGHMLSKYKIEKP